MIDEENVSSVKTIAKVGARRGEKWPKSYVLARDRHKDGIVPEEKLRGLVCWYIDRPGAQISLT